jgi:hypothetical protein
VLVFYLDGVGFDEKDICSKRCRQFVRRPINFVLR